MRYLDNLLSWAKSLRSKPAPLVIVEREAYFSTEVFEKMAEWQAHAIVASDVEVDGVRYHEEEMIKVNLPEYLRAEATMSAALGELLDQYEARYRIVHSITVVFADGGMNHFQFLHRAASMQS